MVRITDMAWFKARKDVLNEFWENRIDFEEFKRRIGEVDKKFRKK